MYLASLVMAKWTEREEADRLRERFNGVNRAEFARLYHVPGGAAMVYQHITGRRPISLEAAQAYARGFGVTLDEISPRLAEDARNALAISTEPQPPNEIREAWQLLSQEQRHLFAEQIKRQAAANRALLDEFAGVPSVRVRDLELAKAGRQPFLSHTRKKTDAQ